METFNTRNGPYRLIVRRDGALDADALDSFMAAAAEGAELIYADEAYTGARGGQTRVCKPAFAPETLLSYNCIGVPMAVTEALYARSGGLREETEEGLYDFALRVSEQTAHVRHVARVLFTGPKPEPCRSIRPVSDAISRRGLRAIVREGMYAGSFAVRYGIRGKPHISVIVADEGDTDAVRFTLEAAEEALNGLNGAFEVVCGGVPPARTLRYYETLVRQKAAHVHFVDSAQNAAALRNVGAYAAEGEALLFLDAGVAPRGCDCFELLLSHIQQRGVGAAGGKVLDQHGRILHCGLVAGFTKAPSSLFSGHRDTTHYALQNRIANTIRNVSGVGGGAILVSAADFYAADGFDETLPVAGYEGELGFRFMRAGRRSVYDPYAVFVRHAGPGPSAARKLPKGNAERLTDLFRAARETGDPMLGRGAARPGGARQRETGQ